MNFAFVKWYPGAFMAGTAHLSNEEVGAYIRLLCWQAQSGELPNDFDRLSRLADGMSLDSWKAIRDKFQVDEATDGLFNERMRAEMTAAADRVAKGRRAADTRWGKEEYARACADALPTHMPKKERERERQKEPQQSLTESNTDPESRLQAAGLDPESSPYKVEVARWGVANGLTPTTSMILPRLVAGVHGPAKGKVWLQDLDARIATADKPAAYLRSAIKQEFGRQ
tara:strand:- start:509 stop:1189 length:681 start_codon:yes stop_codon:yes gene_type:complete